MGRKKMEDLAEFNEWLRKERFMSASTASTYTSRVRHMLANVQPITSEALYAYATTPAQVRSLTPTLSGWTHFVEFGALRGVTVPPFTAAPAIPQAHPLSAPLHALATGEDGAFTEMEVEDLAKLLNKQVRLHLAAMRAYVVKTPDGDARLSAEHVRAVRAWAQNEHDDEAPLIPSEPNGNIPMTVAEMRRHMRGRRA